MLGRMRNRIHSSHSATKNSRDVGHDGLPYFGVHVHERVEAFAGDDGDSYIVHRSDRRRPRLIIYQSHLANDASRTELGNRLPINRLNARRALEDDQQV